jgi:hypothetical protein
MKVFSTTNAPGYKVVVLRVTAGFELPLIKTEI